MRRGEGGAAPCPALASLVLASCGWLAASGALAHGVSSQGGTLRVERHRAVATFPGDAPPALVLRDGSGAPLASSRPHEWTFDEPPRVLTVELAPLDGGPGHVHRVLLEVTSEALDLRRYLLLTSGGNAEVLALRWPGDAAELPREGCVEDALAEAAAALEPVVAIVRRENGAWRVDVVASFGVMESFVPLARAEPGTIPEAEAAAWCERLAAFVASRLRASGPLVGQTRETSDAIMELPVRPLEAKLEGPRAEGRIGAASARVRVSVEAAGAADRLEWGLFNGVVLTARAVLVEGESCETRRLSTYEPVLAQRGAE